jgi:hypothetical protein
VAPAGSRRAVIYRWYTAALVGLLVFGLALGANLQPAIALLCAAAVDAGLFLRQRFLQMLLH